MSQHEIRYIEWVDSSHTAGWQKVANITADEPMKCASVGFVVREGNKHVTIVQSFSYEDGEPEGADAVMMIPRVAITKSRTLRKAQA